MKKILIIIAAFFIVGNAYAQTWLPGPPLRIKDGTDTIDVNGVFSKYTTSFLKYIKGNVGISTNTHDSVLVYDDFTRSIKKKLIAGGGGGTTYTFSPPLINTGGLVRPDTTKAQGNLATFNDVLNSSKWTTSGANIYNNNTGNVGIGMIPTNKLDVLGDIGSRPVSGASQLKVYYDANGFVSLRYGGGKTGLYWGSVDQYFNGVDANNFNTFMNTITPSASNVFQIVGVEKMRLDNAGNLGIGTASPTAKLDVVGTAKISDNVKIGGGTNASAILEVVSNTKGAIPAPLNDFRFVSGNITSPTKGLHAVDSLSGRLMSYDGTQWNRYGDVVINPFTVSAIGQYNGGATYIINPGKITEIDNATATTNFTLNVSTVNQDGYVFEIFNEEPTFTCTFTGATVYQLNGTTVITTIPAGSYWQFKRLNGKIRKTN